MSNPTWTKTARQELATDLITQCALHTLLYGGSRSGKTFLFLYAMIYRGMTAPGSRHCVLRRHFTAIKKSVILDTLPKVLQTCFPDMLKGGKTVDSYLNQSDYIFTIPGTDPPSEIWFGGLDDKKRAEKILGTEFATIFFNECSEFSFESIQIAWTRLAQKTVLVNKIWYDCNPPSISHWTYKMFKEGKNPESGEMLREGSYVSMMMNPEDNKENLPKDYQRNVLDLLSDRQRKRFRDGEFLADDEGALWRREWIADNRVEKAPMLNRIVVGVDPAMSSTDVSDSTGIVVVGLGYDKRVYVLEDRTIKATPKVWAEEVGKAYMGTGRKGERGQANLVVAEVNQGGDLVVTNMKLIKLKCIQHMLIKKIHASVGKVIRAEPVAGVTEQGLIKFVGMFPELEDELCGWSPIDSRKSPDRMDAFVMAVTELLGLTVKPKKTGGVW